MPSLKPRVSVVLEQTDFDALTRLARLQGRSTSAVAREFLHECSTIFNHISDAIEVAQQMQEAAPKELLDRLENAHKKASPVLLELLETLQGVSHLKNF